jgi:hypothetical protein
MTEEGEGRREEGGGNREEERGGRREGERKKTVGYPRNSRNPRERNKISTGAIFCRKKYVLKPKTENYYNVLPKVRPHDFF